MPRGRPRNERLQSLSDEEIIAAVTQAGSLNKAAVGYKIPLRTFKDRAGPLMRRAMSSHRMPKPVSVKTPKRGKKRCFIFSSAQNGTEIHEEFLDNLEAYADYLGAEIHISGFTYNKALFEDHSKKVADFHPRVKPYLANHQFDIVGKLMFCGEQNTLPTATDPLSGFEAYTRSKWGIFPHPRVQMKSIATMFRAPPKIIMTTGAVTRRNYIKKKAGFKAEFHHVIGALLVEVDDDGDFFCRHLIAEKDGSFQDLTIRVDDGEVTDGHRVEAITWGDVHAERLDPRVTQGSWGLDRKLQLVFDDNMLSVLSPKYQFFHDVLDFRRRNHHNIGDPHFMFEMWVRGTERVEEEIAKVGEFLRATSRPYCGSYVVDSNHDRALRRWLRDADYRKDPVNARFFLKCQEALYRAIEEGDERFLVVEAAVREACGSLGNVVFLNNTDSMIICPQAGGGIECALHGDLGANSTKGAINTFARMGPKAIIAHHHSAAIFEGIYQAGHSCLRDMVYNRGGLTSWNPSHVVTYPSGKRVMVTMQGAKYRA